MKVHLMYPNEDFQLSRPLPGNQQELMQDLELNTLLDAMAQGDSFLRDIAHGALLGGTAALEIIVYRQEILQDFLKIPVVVREIYRIVSETIERRREHFFGIFTSHPSSIVTESVHMLEMFMAALKELREISDRYATQATSAGLTALFQALQGELSNDYFERVQAHFQNLQNGSGLLMRVQLGKGNRGTGYTLVKPRNVTWLGRTLDNRLRGYTLHVNPKDEGGGKILSDILDRGLNIVANALAQSTDYIVAFFNQLKVEMAFYAGCLNLYETATTMGHVLCFPVPAKAGERTYSAHSLYNICLALTVRQRVVGNDVEAKGKDLWIITGANQGGKSTFLKAIGVAQLMMQCGMFVPAEALTAHTCRGLFTHFRRQEDASMRSGKFDEELNRMSIIADAVQQNSMLLLNESFAATNEREGSEIARQVIRGMVEHGVKVLFVTHLYDYAHHIYEDRPQNVLFLRAGRQGGGSRTYRIEPGEPLSTSFGRDLYNEILHSNTGSGSRHSPFVNPHCDSVSKDQNS